MSCTEVLAELGDSVLWGVVGQENEEKDLDDEFEAANDDEDSDPTLIVEE